MAAPGGGTVVIALAAALLAAALLAASPELGAHRLKVFAFAEAGRVEGSVYFVGGAAAPGASITVLGPDGEELASPEVNAAGEFAFQVADPVDHRIVAATGDGHQARWSVGAAELGFAAGTSSRGPAGGAASRDGAPPAAGPPDDLAALVEQAVARQIVPLRRQLVACDEQARLRDVLGGLGYILGLAGLAAWWRSRRPAGGR